MLFKTVLAVSTRVLFQLLTFGKDSHKFVSFGTQKKLVSLFYFDNNEQIFFITHNDLKPIANIYTINMWISKKKKKIYITISCLWNWEPKWQQKISHQMSCQYVRDKQNHIALLLFSRGLSYTTRSQWWIGPGGLPIPNQTDNRTPSPCPHQGTVAQPVLIRGQ